MAAGVSVINALYGRNDVFVVPDLLHYNLDEPDGGKGMEIRFPK